MGQQKDKFILALYLYAVRFLEIKSIGDLGHSLIEKQVKWLSRGGPIYTPDGIIAKPEAEYLVEVLTLLFEQ